MEQLAALGYAPDRAVRARLNAIVLDGIIVGLPTGYVVRHNDLATGTFFALALQFLYFFLQEASSGQTLGKRRAHLRVVQLDGSAPTLKQLAIRNALRVFDALPMLYASGLLAVMWSGPQKRQRLGDRVAGTAVILEPGGKSLATPGWLLPTLTVVSVLLSVVIFGVVYDEVRPPHVDANALQPVAVAGFAGDNSRPPTVGRFSAQAIFNGVPAVDPETGKGVVLGWRIAKSCSAPNACAYEMTRALPGGDEETAALVAAADGWHVDFPTRAFRLQCPGRSGLTTVMRRSSYVLHFEPDGRSAEAHERTAYQSDDCGALTAAVDWNASLASF